MNKLMTFTAQKSRPIALAAVMSLSVALTGCGSETEEASAEPVIRPVFIEVASTEQISDLSFNGTIQSENRTELSFRQGGKLTELSVKEGDQVTANQVIAKIDTVDAEIALAAASNELANSRAEYQRAKTLYETRKSISKSQFDEFTLRFKLAQNRYAEAQRMLEDTNLRAPFSGTVSRTYVDNHSLVQGNQSIVTIHDLNNLEAVIHVPESVMNMNSSASEVFAKSPISPQEQLALTLKKYETEADPVTRTYAITFSVESSEATQLLPGMNVSVYSTSTNTNNKSIQLPLTAINPDNLGNQYVWVVDDQNTLHKREVIVGALNGDRAQIEANIETGEQVVVSGTQNLREGLVVRPQPVEVK